MCIMMSKKSLTVFVLVGLISMSVQAAGEKGVTLYQAGVALAAGAGVIWAGSTIQNDLNSVIQEIRDGKDTKKVSWREDAANLFKTLCTVTATTYVGCKVVDMIPDKLLPAVICHGALTGGAFLMLKHVFNNPTLRLREAIAFAVVTGYGRTQLEKHNLALKIGL